MHRVEVDVHQQPELEALEEVKDEAFLAVEEAEAQEISLALAQVQLSATR